jgi:hypothetical protein
MVTQMNERRNITEGTINCNLHVSCLVWREAFLLIGWNIAYIVNL